MSRKCPDCDGMAELLSDSNNGKCSVCHGSGIDNGFIQDALDIDRDCENCGGSGECPSCDGNGQIDDDEEN